MTTPLRALAESVIGKVLFIGAVILLMLIPLGMIEGLVLERARHYDAARESVAASWGATQTVGGPVLIVPFRYTRRPQGQANQPITMTDEIYLLPDELTVTGVLATEERKRGIYVVPVYTASLNIAGSFPPVQLAGVYDDLEILWSRAELALPLTDARSVQEPVVLTGDGGATQFRSGGERIAGFGPQLVASFGDSDPESLAAPRSFSFDLLLGGTGAMRFLPLGDETRVSLTSNWPSPSFVGAYLPDDRSVTDDGFSAEWDMLDLGRGFASTWLRSDAPPHVEASAFGAELITPVGVHEATLRAAKYGVLILALTFVAFFLFELFAGLRMHAIQYLLIGLANTVFYVLLLALAEHIGFAPAYAASAVAAALLVTGYSAAALRSYPRAVPVGALLCGLYAYLYIALIAEDYALLIGAVGSFVVLAALMYLTRQIDWFAVRFNVASERDDPVTAGGV